MTPGAFLDTIIDPGLQFLAEFGPMPTDDVRRFLLCVALQESGPALDARYQGSPGYDPGPARGFLMFEQSGGVAGVLSHTASATLAREVCAALTGVPEAAAVHRALEGHDLLAVCFARLLMLTDPYRVPQGEEEGWLLYQRTWRPGSPHPDAWAGNWQTASDAVAGVVRT